MVPLAILLHFLERYYLRLDHEILMSHHSSQALVPTMMVRSRSRLPLRLDLHDGSLTLAHEQDMAQSRARSPDEDIRRLHNLQLVYHWNRGKVDLLGNGLREGAVDRMEQDINVLILRVPDDELIMVTLATSAMLCPPFGRRAP